MNNFTRWHRLDQLRRHLMYVGYDDLDLRNLDPLRAELEAKELEARKAAFSKQAPATEANDAAGETR